MKNFLQELGVKQENYIVCCDSHGAIHLEKNSAYHSKSKHIDVRYHWIRDVLEKKQLQLEKIHIAENESDMMTKPLPKKKLKSYTQKAGLAVSPYDLEGEIYLVHLIWVAQSQSVISLDN